MRKITLIVLFLTMAVSTAQSQVLLSLLFGDKLNSDKLEFGMSAGFNHSTIRGISEAQGQNNWELGFYFDIRLKEKSLWHIATGVYVKSNVGATNVPLDYTGNPTINDSIFNGFVSANGTVEKKFNTFYVPINFRYLSNIGLFIEGGPQVGLVFKTNDIYNAEVSGSTLNYKVTQRMVGNELYNWIDAGVNTGIGYKFKKGIGMKIGVWYYLGLTNIYKKEIGVDAYNQSLYVLATIPIGKKKAEEHRAEEAAKDQN